MDKKKKMHPIWQNFGFLDKRIVDRYQSMDFFFLNETKIGLEVA